MRTLLIMHNGQGWKLLMWTSLVLLVAVPAAALAQRVDPFAVGGRRAQSAVVLSGAGERTEPVADAPMAWVLAGVVAQLDRGSMRNLFRSVNPRAARPEAPAGAELAYRLRLIAGLDSRTSDIVRDREGRYWMVVESDEHQSTFFPLAEARFQELSAGWPRFHGSLEFESPSTPLGEVFDAQRPFESSRHLLDHKTLRDRVFGRLQSAFGSANVDLSRAQFAARLPKGYDPQRPSGLVVWVAPRDQWKVPPPLHQALDELNCVCIGALSGGNERPPPDRMQLALHAVEIAQARWHIDSRRVYVTGMSGGAKIATMLWAGFPEVFSGAIPIVGLASYKNTPTGKPGEQWPAVFAKPDGRRFKMLKDRPLAPMTGPPDFNYENMVPMAAGLERDGLPVKMFIYENMAHVMPLPPHFLEALGWVDEPYQEMRRSEIDDASSKLADYRLNFSNAPPESEGQRELLGEVMAIAPWSDPAWEAYELLSAGSNTPDS